MWCWPERVRGSIRSISSYAESSDPCIARDAQLTRPLTGDFAQSFGQLDALTCLYSPGWRAVVLRVGSTRRLYGDRSGTGTVSIKQATGNARTGRVFVTFNKTESAKFLFIAPNSRSSSSRLATAGA